MADLTLDSHGVPSAFADTFRLGRVGAYSSFLSLVRAAGASVLKQILPLAGAHLPFGYSIMASGIDADH